MCILKALSKKHEGLTRVDIAQIEDIGGGSVLTKNLLELEECGFIYKTNDFTKGKKGELYRLTDPFTLFVIRFMESEKLNSWNEYINTHGFNSWRGNAFEIVCLNHISQIKSALGISGIETNEFSWRSVTAEQKAQIDLIIDRKDGVINLCEMKFMNDEYALDEDEYAGIKNRLTVFQSETGTKKAIHVTLVSGNGYRRNKYSDALQNVIIGDDLF